MKNFRNIVVLLSTCLLMASEVTFMPFSGSVSVTITCDKTGQKRPYTYREHPLSLNNDGSLHFGKSMREQLKQDIMLGCAMGFLGTIIGFLLAFLVASMMETSKKQKNE